MSHITTHKMKIKNVDLFCNVAEYLGHTVRRGNHIVKQYGYNSVNAVASIHLKDWRYPVAITSQGEIKYDHWGSKGGQKSMDYLGECLQQYSVQHIEQNIDYTQVEFYDKKVVNGETIITIEY